MVIYCYIVSFYLSKLVLFQFSIAPFSFCTTNINSFYLFQFPHFFWSFCFFSVFISSPFFVPIRHYRSPRYLLSAFSCAALPTSSCVSFTTFSSSLLSRLFSITPSCHHPPITPTCHIPCPTVPPVSSTRTSPTLHRLSICCSLAHAPSPLAVLFSPPFFSSLAILN